MSSLFRTCASFTMTTEFPYICVVVFRVSILFYGTVNRATQPSQTLLAGWRDSQSQSPQSSLTFIQSVSRESFWCVGVSQNISYYNFGIQQLVASVIFICFSVFGFCNLPSRPFWELRYFAILVVSEPPSKPLRSGYIPIFARFFFLNISRGDVGRVPGVSGVCSIVKNRFGTAASSQKFLYVIDLLQLYERLKCDKLRDSCDSIWVFSLSLHKVYDARPTHFYSNHLLAAKPLFARIDFPASRRHPSLALRHIELTHQRMLCFHFVFIYDGFHCVTNIDQTNTHQAAPNPQSDRIL